MAGIGKAANDLILNIFIIIIIVIIIIIIIILSQKKKTQVNGRNWGIFSMIKHSLWDPGLPKGLDASKQRKFRK